MASIGFSKVFILDKYFSELQKFWETEKKLQGMKVEDSISSPEAAHLELRLKTLSTELVTLRNRLHVNINNPSRTNSARINPAPIIHGYNKPLPVPPQQPVADYVNQIPKEVDLVQSCPSSKRSGSMIGTRTTSSARSESSTSSSAGRILTDVDDLVHLPGPLTEDAIIKCLHNRSTRGEYFVSMGQILLLGNPQTLHNNPLTLHSTQSIPPPSSIQRVVQEALRQQAETNYPQAIILSGWTGSGKTYASMLILRELFNCAGGSADGFKHLSAAVTVLRSLGSASTAVNKECSRIGHFIEVQVSDGTLYRTKVHCYFLDQSRVVKCLQDEKNYHIFYQMMAGLNPEERSRLHLDTHSLNTLRYLRSARKWDEIDDAGRFAEWKACLGTLGIPFLDVVRVLAAVLLLGNISFQESCMDMEIRVEDQIPLSSAAALLGVSETAIRQGLTTRTHNTRSQLVRSRCSANISNSNRDALAKSLYCRTLATIVRRANSSKRMDSATSSDSTDSVHHDVASQHASTVGTAGSKASKSMTALNNAVRHCQDGFIGILDMFGFESLQPSSLEHLCINLSAETMQHFYNTHIFKACLESCRDEGISCDWEVDYTDNVPCIDLISSLKTGLLSMLDVECSVNGSVENYIQKVHLQHPQNHRLTETGSRSFAIQHFAGKVNYDATMFTETNRDILSDDLVAVFHKHRCSFGFASHLFSSELKILGAGGIEPSPKGINFRISPTSHSEMLNGMEPLTTLTQDFHTRLDNLLRTLVHARPHFIRCIKLSENNFDRVTVSKQLRSFQVLESLNLMVNGYPHRMRFKGFMSRYKLLGGISTGADDCVAILEKYFKGKSWAVGKKHVFISEVMRQELEYLRSNKINGAATLIQSVYRGWVVRKRSRMSLPVQEKAAQMLMTPAAMNSDQNLRPRPQPITGTPPPDETSPAAEIRTQSSSTAHDTVQSQPSLPQPRSYTINGNLKLSFPQIRILKMNFVQSSGFEVSKGESVLVLGNSAQRRGHFIVEYKNRNIQVPHQYLQLKL